MESYSFLRQLADSWVLVVMVLFFLGIIVWVFRPGSKKTYEDTANIPFRHEDEPDTETKNDKPATSKEEER